jgi:catechol 2,3-dioxygenase-like lactoylglutathione lyase family enzyme
MITKMSHTSIFVLDQDSAYDFYINKLGFEVRTDVPMGPGFRWLTVGPKEQPDLEIILMPIKAGMMFTEETAEMMKTMIAKGASGAGVFETPDVMATYHELTAKGVKFKGEPKVQPYGTEAIMLDDSGNWFSITQRKEGE